MRFIKFVGSAFGLWLVASVGLIVWVNTSSDEQKEKAIEAAVGVMVAPLEVAVAVMAGPPAEELPPDNVMLAETETLLAEVEALYDELVGIREAIEAAHTDEWEKRWARDAVTLARMDKKRAVEAVNQRRERAESSQGLASARRSAELQKASVEREVAKAREKLRSIGGARDPVE